MVDPLEALVEPRTPGTLRVGLAVPASGPLGLTGPAAMACARLAAEEANDTGGAGGRPVELVPLDAGRSPAEVSLDVTGLLRAGAIDALCGFHTSDVHRRLEMVTAGRIPYVFTPPHEGGRRRSGVVLLGDDPRAQLLPVSRRLASRRGLHRWALLGNDYIWPQAVHAAAADLLRAAGADVVLERLIPFGRVRPERLIAELVAARVDAVVLSLVGRDLATFNRAFARAHPRRTIVRVSGSLDETGLLEADGDGSGDLYAVMRWFATDAQSEDFRGHYTQRWGASAPVVSTYAHGCYQGIGLIARLARGGALDVDTVVRAASVCADPHLGARLARADGLDLVAVP